MTLKNWDARFSLEISNAGIGTDSCDAWPVSLCKVYSRSLGKKKNQIAAKIMDAGGCRNQIKNFECPPPFLTGLA